MTPATITDKSSIVEKCVFVQLGFGLVGSSRTIAGEEILNTDADKKLLTVHKRLFESEEFEAIRKLDRELRTYLKGKCLPYEKGWLILPNDLLEEVNARMEEHAKIRPELVESFIKVYPTILQKAEENLHSQFNLGDYPPEEEVRAAFYFNYDYLNFAVPEVLKYKGMYETQNAKLSEKFAHAGEEITILMRQSLLELVNHLKKALEPTEEGKPKRLFSSTISNVQDFINTFKERNITSDAELEKLVEDVKILLHPGVDIDVIRKDESFKTAILEGVTSISEKLTDLTEVIPGRKFKNIE